MCINLHSFHKYDYDYDYDYEISLFGHRRKKQTQRFHKQQNGRNGNKKY